MKLDQFLKWKGIALSGGQAKQLINSGVISVNGEVENRRGRKLKPGDKVVFGNNEFILQTSDPPRP